MIKRKIPLTAVARVAIFPPLLLLIIWTRFCFAEDTFTEQSLHSLVAQLSSASFAKKLTLVDEIEEVAGEASLPILEAFLAGQLYYLKQEQDKVFQAVKIEQDNYQILDIYTTAQVEYIDKQAFRARYKKVRINNRLRKKIKLSLSRISLSSGSEASKMQALNALMDGVDESSASLVESLYVKERSKPVKKLMSVVLAVHQLKQATRGETFNQQTDDQTEKQKITQALDLLDGRLEVSVKVALINFKAHLEDLTADDANYNHDLINPLLSKTNAIIHSIEEEINFFLFVEKLFFGLSLGSVLLLAAIGLAITFGVMGIINMAHGEMIMLGAYTTYVVQLLMPNLINYSLFVAVPAAFLVAALVGIVIQRTVIRYLYGRPLETLLATFGISLILRQAVRTLFSPLNRQVDQPSWMSGALELNPVLSLTYNRLYILAFSLLVFIALVFVIKKTSLGLNVRAVSQNRDMAKAMGVKTEWVDALTFGLGSGVAGVAGVALSQLTNVGPNLGQAYIIDSFMVVVFGGVGNLMGTLVASFSLGAANKFMEPITGTVLANILVLVFIILFIQKRPRGLFPQKGRAAE